MRFPAPRQPRNLAEFHRWALDLHRELEKFAVQFGQTAAIASTPPAPIVTPSYVHLIFAGSPPVFVTDVPGNQFLVAFEP